jgi:hypothetical protein
MLTSGALHRRLGNLQKQLHLKPPPIPSAEDWRGRLFPASAAPFVQQAPAPKANAAGAVARGSPATFHLIAHRGGQSHGP